MLRVSASGVFLFLTFFLRSSSQFKGKKKSHVPEIIKDAKGRSQSSIINERLNLRLNSGTLLN